ncbi:hypothetical protein Pan265_08610 [Mucisphaera calidilacus]|uniref:Uncharacterized protein n=1 Tax=Mucisphaera calidilacus TaxID=2527982 RepID=A0A518BVL2_9BACT|nr:hypothetical protein Pan265_08610 [Mucisphaera calidilacus]
MIHEENGQCPTFWTGPAVDQIALAGIISDLSLRLDQVLGCRSILSQQVDQ